MSTHEFERNVAGDVVGVRPKECDDDACIQFYEGVPHTHPIEKPETA